MRPAGTATSPPARAHSDRRAPPLRAAAPPELRSATRAVSSEWSSSKSMNPVPSLSKWLNIRDTSAGARPKGTTASENSSRPILPCLSANVPAPPRLSTMSFCRVSPSSWPMSRAGAVDDLAAATAGAPLCATAEAVSSEQGRQTLAPPSKVNPTSTEQLRLLQESLLPT